MSIKNDALARTRIRETKTDPEKAAKDYRRRFAKNRQAYKSSLWQVILYVIPGKDDDIKAGLLAKDNINDYLKKLIRADMKGKKGKAAKR